MNKLIKAHKYIIQTIKEQLGLTDYGIYWLAFLEGGLTVWLIMYYFSIKWSHQKRGKNCLFFIFNWITVHYLLIIFCYLFSKQL